MATGIHNGSINAGPQEDDFFEMEAGGEQVTPVNEMFNGSITFPTGKLGEMERLCTEGSITVSLIAPNGQKEDAIYVGPVVLGDAISSCCSTKFPLEPNGTADITSKSLRYKGFIKGGKLDHRQGDAVLEVYNKYKWTGGMREGLPHGQGIFEKMLADRGRFFKIYEGKMARGQPETGQYHDPTRASDEDGMRQPLLVRDYEDDLDQSAFSRQSPANSIAGSTNTGATFVNPAEQVPRRLQKWMGTPGADPEQRKELCRNIQEQVNASPEKMVLHAEGSKPQSVDFDYVVGHVISLVGELRELSLNNLMLSASSVKHFTRLESLTVSKADLPAIEGKDLALLTNLTELNLQLNNMDKLSRNIGHLTKLTGLNVSSNPVQELPASIGNCLHLTTLSINSTAIAKLPEGLSKLQRLYSLQMDKLPMQKFPAVVCQVKSLTQLHARESQLKDLPEAFCQLTALRELKLTGSPRFTKLPENFGELKALETLDLSKTGLKELPRSFMELTALKACHLLNIRGFTFAVSVSKMPSLEVLRVDRIDLALLKNELGYLPGNFALTTIPGGQTKARKYNKDEILSL